MSESVTLTIDGIEVTVPKGTLVIRAAERLGIEIPRFCDHPLLEPAGACRQCLVDVEGQRKPLASCTATCTDGMVVKTQLTSPVAKKAQEGIMEFLLLNHPLDCPICDKGGECPLQNQAMSTGRTDSRFKEEKRTYRKALPISSQVLLDRERCVLCARCTRFSDQIAGDPFIELMERSSLEQVGIYEDEPFESYFSGNTVQICPVGALTGTQYRFQARPFDLVSSPSMCEHCSAGCAQRTDHRRNKVTRRLAGDDPQVNEEWNCDKGRWAFNYVNTDNRILTPLVRGADGELHEASWPDALRAAAEGLRHAMQDRGVGVLTGGRLTIEDAYAYAKFSRVVLSTNDVDFRARPHSDEEAEFLAHAVAGVHPAGGATTYADVAAAPAVLIAGLEAEEECPILFLRLRKANKETGLRPYVVAPYATAGTAKMGGELIPTVPGGEATLLSGYADGGDMAEVLRAPGSVILVGERLATVPGALTAVARLAKITGAKLAWVPRRAGDRGAVDAGVLPNLLPGGGSVTDASDRAAVAEYWNVDSLPDTPGRGTEAMLSAASSKNLSALLVAGVDPADLANPAAAEAGLYEAPFIVSIEQRHTAVTRRANVVFPIAPVAEKGGAYLNWEGRLRTFDATLDSSLMSDFEVLDALAAAMGTELGFESLRAVRGELAGVPIPAERPGAPLQSASKVSIPLTDGEALLATWRHLLDSGTLQDNNEHLAGTARTPVVRLSAGTASSIGAADGDAVTVSSGTGGITLPLTVTRMPDGVVWLPTNSPGSGVHRGLGVGSGDVVSIATYNGGTK